MGEPTGSPSVDEVAGSMPENAAQVGTEKTAQPPRTAADLAQVVTKVTNQAHKLVRTEIAFALQNLKAKAKKLGLGGALVGAAAFFGVFAFLFILLGVALAIAQAVPAWAAFLIVAGGLLFVALVLMLVGLVALEAAKKHIVDPKTGIEKDVEAVKKGLGK